jgi:hypothetical protein
LIDSRFILETKIRDPTRMTLVEVQSYWQHWALKAGKGDPFTFLVDKGAGKGEEEIDEEEVEDEEKEEEGGGGEGERRGKGRKKEKGKKRKGKEKENEETEDEEDEEEKEKSPTPPTPDFDIDQGIPLPCQCDGSTVRTHFLQKLSPNRGTSGKTYHALVKQVDTLEVSFI